MKNQRFFISILLIISINVSLGFFSIWGKNNRHSEILDGKKGTFWNSTDSLILSLIQQTNLDTLIYYVNSLSGEDSIYINDSTYLIISRHSDHPHNDVAADFIEQKLNELGLSVINQNYSESGRNVYAVQEGVYFPDQKYIICAHYDDMPSTPPAPGADDNASGVAAVLEAARILSQIQTPYTIIYALWDEEESGGIGSGYFAQNAAQNGEDIKGVVNLEMLGWDSDNDKVIDIHTDDYGNSVRLAKIILELIGSYQIGLDPLIFYPGASNSDHGSFWINGFTAVVFGGAYMGGDFNDYYHTSNDRIIHFNHDYFYALSKLAVASISYLSLYGDTLMSPVDSNVTFIGNYAKACRDVEIAENIGYLVSVDSVELVDISNPTSLMTLSIVHTHGLGGLINPPGNYAYIAHRTPYFSVLDIANPFFPELVGYLRGAGGDDLYISGNYAYSVRSSNYNFIGGLDIIDISIPTDPQLVSSSSWRLWNGKSIAISENYAIVGHAAQYDTPGSVEVIDITSPDSLVFIKRIDIAHSVKEIVISNKIAYVAAGLSGLRIIDFSNPNQLSEVGFYDEDGAVFDVAIVGNFAYLSNGFYGFRVIDISSKSNPQEVGYFDTGGVATGVAADNEYIYVADRITGLHILQNNLFTSIKANKSHEYLSNFNLSQNYPNPFNTTTTIEFTNPKAGFVSLKIYNILGEEVKTFVSKVLTAGEHKYLWDANGLASGMYLIKLESNNNYKIIKALLLK